MGRMSASIVNQISSPIDAVNRFINLTLQSTGENSVHREFLLESKQAIRKTSALLRRLNNYTRKIEQEIREIATSGE